MELNGKTALVTGGGAGIGAGIAERLAAEGMDVVIADVDQEAGAMTAGKIRGSFVRADVATEAGVGAAVAAACRAPSPLGVLVSNAGGAAEPCFPAADPAQWGHTLDLNLRAVMLAVQLVLDPMAAAGGGAIITVASVAGLGTTSHDCPEYAPADIAAAAMRFLADDTLAGRIMVCRGGEGSRLQPLVDWQCA
jgi:NAD(P)-dependent dehydrogenase (short-subunit alcohol dehydrogenase family)